jgi:hypothetical protein
MYFTLIMIRFFTVFSLLFGNGMTQISPIRDPVLPVAPTIGPVINTIGPIRTIQPIRTLSPVNRTSTNAPLITSSTSTESDTEITENGDDLALVYALVPTGILVLILVVLLCVRRKRAIINNNVVNVDIENVLPSNTLVKQPSVNSNRFSSHTYEAVDYESRYEMPDTPKYENVFSGDKGKNNEYGSQVNTIV